MKRYLTLLLRVAIGIGFLSAVADRLGFWGPPAGYAVAWGNWDNFIHYVSVLNFGAGEKTAIALGIISTLLEIVFGFLLILGFRIKYTAFFSGIMLLLFALEMSFNTSIKFALDSSVFVAAFGSFLLAANPQSKWAVDNLIHK